MVKRGFAVGLLLSLALTLGVASQAFGATVSFDRPDADYLAKTIKFDFSGYATDTVITSLADANNQIFFDHTAYKRQVPIGWGTWASPPFTESATPAVLYVMGDALNMQLARPVRLFGFEIEPNFGTNTETVTFRAWKEGDVVAVETTALVGSSGARLCAVQSDAAFTRIEIKSSSTSGFAVGQLRYALGTALTKPAVSPTSPKKGKTTTFSTKLSPLAAITGGTVSVECYRKESGKWKLRKTVALSVAPDGNAFGTGKLAYTGSWRSRAVYGGIKGFLPSTSAYRTFTVK